MIRLLLATTFLLSLATAAAQQQQYQIGAIGFYNFENLFDTLDTENVNDTEFTPAGSKHYTGEIYHDKLGRLARVVSEMATDVTPDGLSMLGISEIENRGVLEDFVKERAIADRNYQIVHYDSPDKRGIDVALLYQAKYFTVDTSHALLLEGLTYADGDTVFTRNILLVSGHYGGDPLHVMVNHWPSRRGGEAASAPLRNFAAGRAKAAADSILAADPTARVIIMGDLNDDPVSPSVRKILKAQDKPEKTGPAEFYNPYYNLFRHGKGTGAYRDAWSLFDQILITGNAVGDQAGTGWRFYQGNIYNAPYMYEKSGQYRGYPLRSFSWDTYNKGYSDHFPVYMLLVKPQ